jgi:ABC-type Fe3+-hydroxamate transport system substrate-binding protein
MFLKKSTVTKNGKTYSYYKIVAAYKAEDGKNKHRLIKHVGRLSDQEADAMRDVLKEQQRQSKATLSLNEKISRELLESSLFVPKEIQSLIYAPYSQKEWNVADSDTLIMVRQGSGMLYMNGRKHELKQDTALFCHAGSGMHLFNENDQTLELDKITFDVVGETAPLSTERQYFRKKLDWPQFGEVRLSSAYRAHQLVKQLKKAATGEPYRHLFQAQLLFYELLHLIFQEESSSHPFDSKSTIERAVAYMREHYREELSRELLARMHRVSPSYFSRMFKKEKGTSFVEYLTRLRIEKARELLQLSNATISSISKEVGIKNEYYFSRKFKQLIGESPSAYAKRPKQFVSLIPNATSCLLTLGIVPRLGHIDPWMLEHYGTKLSLSGFQRIDWWSQESEELVSHAKPDLILCYMESQGLEALREIAPVLPLAYDQMNWREQFRMIADAVGKRESCEGWLAQFDRQLEDARKQLAKRIGDSETVTILKIVSEKIYVYGDLRSMGGPLIYQGLQLKAPAIVQANIIEQRKLNEWIPLQALPEYAGDHIILHHYPSHWVEPSEQLAHSSVWKSLPAVQNNRVYETNADIFYGFDPLSLSLQLKLLLEHFTSHSS